MIYDVRTIKSSLDFLSKVFSTDRNKIYEEIKRQPDYIYLSEFMEILNCKLANIDLDSLKLVVSHVTTTIDDNKFLLENDLTNLQNVLIFDSPLKNFLKRFNIGFNIKKKVIICNDITYSINRNDYDRYVGFNNKDAYLKELSRKVYTDHQITAFLTMESDTKYLGEVHLRPEVLLDISRVIGINLCQEWYDISKSQVIEFYVDVKNLEPCSFDLRNDKYLSDKEYNNYISKWLVEKAINIILNNLLYKHPPENVIYIEHGHVVSRDDMIDIRSVNNSRYEHR